MYEKMATPRASSIMYTTGFTKVACPVVLKAVQQADFRQLQSDSVQSGPSHVSLLVKLSEAKQQSDGQLVTFSPLPHIPSLLHSSACRFPKQPS